MVSQMLAFAFYTLAMVGVLFLAMVVYKKTTQTSLKGIRGMIKIEEMMGVAPRKSLMIIRIKNQRFLIANDPDATRFLTQLEDGDSQFEEQEEKTQALEEVYPEGKPKGPVMKELLRKMGR